MQIYNFFEGYKTGWKLFLKAILKSRIKYSEKEKLGFVIAAILSFILLALLCILAYNEGLLGIWAIIGSFGMMIMIFLPTIGFIYSPLFRKHPTGSFLFNIAYFVVYLIVDMFLALIFLWISDSIIEFFFTD